MIFSSLLIKYLLSNNLIFVRISVVLSIFFVFKMCHVIHGDIHMWCSFFHCAVEDGGLNVEDGCWQAPQF